MDEFQQNPWMWDILRMDRRQFSRIAAGFLLYNLLGAGLQIIFVSFLRLWGWNGYSGIMNLSWVLNIVCMYLLAFPITAFYFRSVPKFGHVRNERWELKAWIVVFFMASALSYFGNLLGNLVTGFFGASSNNYEGLMEMVFQADMGLTFLAVVVGAPIVEEMIFRKFLIDRTIGYGEKLSVLLSGALFGLMHGNLNQFFYTFALGCLFAYIYCKTGRIRNCIVFHMLINLGGGIIAPMLLRSMDGLLSLSGFDSARIQAQYLLSHPAAVLPVLFFIAYVLFQLAASVIGLVMFYVFRRYICFYPGIRRIPENRVLQTVVLNPGMICFLLLCLFSFFA